jgi:hypothetical protein
LRGLRVFQRPPLLRRPRVPGMPAFRWGLIDS